ncbi:hypothetical protein YYC_05266 [Plasmodium yoelii 17X]|uniref:subtilisin n=1 Tax=Plasmodium yoelii 17X TaxID=1323249 RepID=V7PBV8_PLAYE|nr:hypothetical protein YYC_05266 [Plasmodium yoelii 17X]
MKVKYLRYIHIWSLIYHVCNVIYNRSLHIIEIRKKTEIGWGRNNRKIRILNQINNKELEINKNSKTNIYDIFSDDDIINNEIIMKNYYKNLKKTKFKISPKIHRLIISFKNENNMLNYPGFMNKKFIKLLNYCGKIKKLEHVNLYLYDITPNKSELLIKFCLYALKNNKKINVEADYKLKPIYYNKFLKNYIPKNDYSLHSNEKKKNFQINNSSMFKNSNINLKKYKKINIIEEQNDISELIKGTQLSNLYEKHNVNVCIIDTGINYNHPDLKDSIIDMKSTEGNYRQKKKQDNKYDFFSVSNPIDEHGHGTFIAGIIAGNGNNININGKEGIQGINKMAKLIICKALNNNNVGNISDVLECFNYCAEKNAKIINASFSTKKNYPHLYYALKELEKKGIIVVTSSGNCVQKGDEEYQESKQKGDRKTEANTNSDGNSDGGGDGNSDSGGYRECNLNLMKLYPPAYLAKLTNLLVVSNIDKDSNNDIILSKDSCYSNKYVNFGTQGNDILSTHINNQYAISGGSSFSAAIVTGVISLLFSINPNLNNNEIIDLIKNSIIQTTKLKNKVKWEGYLNVYLLIKLMIEKMGLTLVE